MNELTKMQLQKAMMPTTVRPNKSILQRAAVNSTSVNRAPPLVQDVLRSSGQPLDPATRAFMEPRFGHDFSQVRVYMDGKAAESAQTIERITKRKGKKTCLNLN